MKDKDKGKDDQEIRIQDRHCNMTDKDIEIRDRCCNMMDPGNRNATDVAI